MEASRRLNDTILQLRAEGKSYQYIKETLHVGKTRIAQVLKGMDEVKWGGRPSKVTSEILKFIEGKFLENARLSDDDVVSLVNSEY